MPLLTPSSVHIDAPLTNLTLAYAQSQEAFAQAQKVRLLFVRLRALPMLVVLCCNTSSSESAFFYSLLRPPGRAAC